MKTLLLLSMLLVSCDRDAAVMRLDIEAQNERSRADTIERGLDSRLFQIELAVDRLREQEYQREIKEKPEELSPNEALCQKFAKLMEADFSKLDKDHTDLVCVISYGSTTASFYMSRVYETVARSLVKKEK